MTGKILLSLNQRLFFGPSCFLSDPFLLQLLQTMLLLPIQLLPLGLKAMFTFLNLAYLCGVFSDLTFISQTELKIDEYVNMEVRLDFSSILRLE